MEKRLEWLMMLQLHRSDTHSSDAVDRFVTTAALNFLRGFRTIELSFDFLHAEIFLLLSPTRSSSTISSNSRKYGSSSSTGNSMMLVES